MGEKKTIDFVGGEPKIDAKLAESRGARTPFKDCFEEPFVEKFPNVFPICAVIRVQSRRTPTEDGRVDLSDMCAPRDGSNDAGEVFENDNGPLSAPLDKKTLIEEQRKDPEIFQLSRGILSGDEFGNNPACFYRESGVSMRKWRHRASRLTASEMLLTKSSPTDVTEKIF